jgi:hypothetical protein
VKRLVIAAALAGAAALSTVPAHAAGPVGGYCTSGSIQVACREGACDPETPCTIQICLVWIKSCTLG